MNRSATNTEKIKLIERVFHIKQKESLKELSDMASRLILKEAGQLPRLASDLDNALQEGIEDFKAGRTNSHEDVMEAMRNGIMEGLKERKASRGKSA